MDFKLILLVIGVLAGALAFGWLSSGGGLPGPASTTTPLSPVPVILRIEFPEQIPASENEVSGQVQFADPNGDIVAARFELIDAIAFEGFEIDLSGAQGIERGYFTFSLFSALAQDVRLRVILVDAEGHESEGVELSFRAVGQDGP